MMLAGKEVHAPQPKMSFLSSVGFIPIRGSSNGQRPVVSAGLCAGFKRASFPPVQPASGKRFLIFFFFVVSSVQ
jgi:hypothetical protein